MKSIKSLSIDENKQISLKMQGDDTFIRTGVCKDGSCFYHALLYAYDSRYATMSFDERKDLVIKMRTQLADTLSVSRWEKLGKGEIPRLTFSLQFSNNLKYLYKYFLANDNEKLKIICKYPNINHSVSKVQNTKKFKAILSLYPIENFLNDNDGFLYSVDMPDGFKKWKKEVLQNVKDDFESSLKDQGIIQEKIDKCSALYLDIVKQLVKDTCIQVFELYRNTLSNSSHYVDETHIEYISDKIKRDIYFINANTRLPYIMGNKDLYKKRKSIMILWTEENHYESLGVSLSNNDDEQEIERQLEHEDDVISVMYDYLCDKSSFSMKYPQYSAYLPKNDRNRFKSKIDITK